MLNVNTSSLQFRTFIMVAILSLFILSMYSYYVIGVRKETAYASLTAKAKTVSDQYAESLSLSLWNFDEDSIQYQLKALSHYSDFCGATVTLSDGNEFASYKTDEVIDPIKFEKKIIYQRNNLVEELGTLIICFSTYETEKNLLREINALIFLSVIVFFLMLVTLVISFRQLFSPLTKLKAVMPTVGEELLQINDPVLTRGDEIGSVTLTLNKLIAAIKENQSKLKGALEEAEDERNKAQEALRVKSDFLATMSHEIRTPMNGIIGMTELLLQSSLSEKQHRQAKIVANCAYSLLEIINDILDFSKIEAGKMDIEKTAFDFKSVCQEVVSLIETKSDAKGIDILFEYDRNVSSDIEGDPVRVRQIINNLLGNAVKFTEKGHIKLSVSKKYAESNNSCLRIEVEDTGIGIPEGAKKKLFTKFSQADSSTTRRYGGTGLGLAICSSLASLMGGEIGFDSTEGKGSVFWVTIMAKELNNTHHIPSGELNIDAKGESMRFENIHVLLAEDNEFNVEYVRTVLEEAKCKVTVACNGKEAVDKVLKLNESIDLILMDGQMPEMDGYEATAIIRQLQDDDKLPSIPIIALTANAMKGDAKKALSAGMHDYLSKPVGATQLLEVMGKWLSQGVK